MKKLAWFGVPVGPLLVICLWGKVAGKEQAPQAAEPLASGQSLISHPQALRISTPTSTAKMLIVQPKVGVVDPRAVRSLPPQTFTVAP